VGDEKTWKTVKATGKWGGRGDIAERRGEKATNLDVQGGKFSEKKRGHQKKTAPEAEPARKADQSI